GSGDLNSTQQGSGIDFSETRPYQPGDEPRHINWRATARTGKPQVRVFHKDLSPHCYFLIDRRTSMRFGTRTRLKVTQAARLALFLASWEVKQGSELGSLMLNSTPQWQAATNGQQAIQQLAQSATLACPPLGGVANFSFKYALSLLAEQIPQGSHVYLLSDFQDVTTDLQAQLYQLGQNHQVLAISIYDIAEHTLPKAGYLQLSWELHRGHQDNRNDQLIDTRNNTVQEDYQLRFNENQENIKQLCKKSDINYISISSQTENIVSALQATLA
ncbi:MAG: DUF58 domain-containing protein, partial [Methylococcales bacterium]